MNFNAKRAVIGLAFIVWLGAVVAPVAKIFGTPVGILLLLVSVVAILFIYLDALSKSKE